jgi:TonB family protein
MPQIIHKSIYPFAVSVFVHAGILLLFILSFNFISPTKNSAGNNVPIIHAYVIFHKQESSAHLNSSSVSSDIKSPKTIEKTHAQKIISTSLILAKATPQNTPKGNLQNSLVLLLHQAIQAAQIYPVSALTMHRSGRATVSFTLLPNGSINHLRLINSSGTASLDNAALSAVQNASPFQGVSRYLTSTREFQIDVVFELPPESD